MKKYFCLLVLFCGCQSAPPAVGIKIRLINKQQSLAISGIDAVVLNDIDRDPVKSWQSLFAIYRMPADTDMKDYQPVQPGQYQLKDTIVAFTPDTPFNKRSVYFLRYYQHTGNSSIWNYLQGKTTKAQLHYTDLIFKQ